MKEFIKNLDYKKALPYTLAVLIFLGISSVFYYNQLSGLRVYQHDLEKHIGMSKESYDFRDKYDEETLWTNAAFGGMPTYQISMKNANIVRSVDKIILKVIPRPIGYMFLLMLGFFIFLLLVKVDPKLAIIGSIAFGLASYNVLYIGAGHNNKIHALAYIPPILGSIIYAYRKNFLIGSALLAFFSCLHLSANHMQLTYYMLYAVLAVAILQFYVSYKEKALQRFFKASLFLLLAGFLSLLPSAKSLLLTQEYSDYTTRGKSELSQELLDKTDVNEKGSGLGKEYITQYSLGDGEIWALIIPNVKGGKQGVIGNDKKIMDKIDSEEDKQLLQNQSRYWGEQNSSGGAIYFGASVFLLFVLGLVFVKDKLKWAFLAVSVLAVLLSLKYGALTEFAINKFPMFSKFRDTKMILILVQISFAFIGILFVKYLLENPIKQKTFFYVSGGVVAMLLLFVMFPTAWFDFTSKNEVEYLEYLKSLGLPDNLSHPAYQNQQVLKLKMDLDALPVVPDLRVKIFQADTFRSLFFILLTGGAVYLFIRKKIDKMQLIVSLGLIIMVDLFMVDKRYFTNDKVVDNMNKWVDAYSARNPFTASYADSAILRKEIEANPALIQKIESGLSELDESEFPVRKQFINEENKVIFRELNLNTNYRVLAQAVPVGIMYAVDQPQASGIHAFSDGRTPYFHKSLGGYHGAKLQRYEEVWDYYIANEDDTIRKLIQKSNYQAYLVEGQLKNVAPVLNMLNTKYIISHPFTEPITNKACYGNAWFVKGVKIAQSADEEFLALEQVTKDVAIIHESFRGMLPQNLMQHTGDTIYLTDYKPNHLRYKSKAQSAQLAVFSEIYYDKGWNSYIDGKKVEYLRANYLLRALKVPSGEHTIEFKFEPATYSKANALSVVGSILLLLYILGALGYEFYFKRRKTALVNE